VGQLDQTTVVKTCSHENTQALTHTTTSLFISHGRRYHMHLLENSNGEVKNQ
jgi:hypothetical protein